MKFTLPWLKDYLDTSASLPAILEALKADPPDILMLGHSGSTSAHPTCLQITAAVRAALPGVTIVYGGVYPSYHWQDILTEAPQIDVIVRGEGEVTVVALAAALASGTPLDTIPGLAFRRAGQPFATPPAPMIRDLDQHRTGWELIDFTAHSYWGGL